MMGEKKPRPRYWQQGIAQTLVNSCYVAIVSDCASFFMDRGFNSSSSF